MLQLSKLPKIRKIVTAVFCLLMAGLLLTEPGFSFAQLQPTIDQLQTQIQRLQQELVQLQAQLGVGGGGTTTPATSSAGTTAGSSTVAAACANINFNRNLTIGSTGQDVRCLQVLLNQSPDTRVAISGAGSPGSETSYFGARTRAAVIKFQEKNASTILAPLGLTRGTGYVGPATRPVLNSTLAAILMQTPSGGTSTTTPPTGGQGSGLNITGQEGTMAVTVNPTPATGTRVYAGDREISIMGIRVQARGSDLSVQRVTFEFNARPYDFFSELYLYDGDRLVSSDELDSGSVSRVSPTSYTFTMSNFSSPVIVRKDETRVLTVKADINNAIASDILPSGSSANITISVASGGIRAVDQANLNQYGPASAGAVTRTVNINHSQSTNAAIVVSQSNSNPLSRNIVAGINESVDEASLLVFNVRAQRDDVTINEINDVVFRTDAGYMVPLTAYLYDDTNSVIGTAAPSPSTGLVSFTDLNSRINRDSTRSYTIKIDDTLAADSSDDGKAYQVAVYATTGATANFIVEKSNGANVAASNMSGSAISNPTYVYAVAPVFTLASVTTNSTASSQTAAATISATFNIQVKAEGGDIYIPKTGAFRVYSVRGNQTPGTLVTNTVYTKPAGVTEYANSYRIAQDSTATFAVNATYILSGTAGNYDLRVEEIRWGTSDATASSRSSTYMSGDYVSGIRFLQ